jgi:hypothetical protein
LAKDKEFNELKRKMVDDKTLLENNLRLEIQKKEMESELKVKTIHQELKLLKEEKSKLTQDLTMKVENTKEQLLMEMTNLKNEKNFALRKTKEEAELSVDKLKIKYEMELQQQNLDMQQQIKEYVEGFLVSLLVAC